MFELYVEIDAIDALSYVYTSILRGNCTPNQN